MSNLFQCSECEEVCEFKNETVADVETCFKLYEDIFEDIHEEKVECSQLEKVKTYLISGMYGSGKTEKVKRVLSLAKKYKNVDGLKFDSFQSGFSDNFIFILYQKRKHELSVLEKVKLFFLLCVYNIKNFPLYFSVVLPVMVIFLTVFANLDENINVGILDLQTLVISVMVICLVIIYFLPEILTIKKEYSIINRNYYFSLTSKILPEILVIDDFERLELEQQSQILEYIDYVMNSKENINLKKIILVGEYKLIGATENIERKTNEKKIDKYVDRILILPNWKKAFSDSLVHRFDFVNGAEAEAIFNYLKVIDTLVTRRLLDKLMLSLPIDTRDMTEKIQEHFYVRDPQEMYNALSANTYDGNPHIFVNKKKKILLNIFINKGYSTNKIIEAIDIIPGQIDYVLAYSPPIEEIAINLKEQYNNFDNSARFIDLITKQYYLKQKIEFTGKLDEYIKLKDSSFNSIIRFIDNNDFNKREFLTEYPVKRIEYLFINQMKYKDENFLNFLEEIISIDNTTLEEVLGSLRYVPPTDGREILEITYDTIKTEVEQIKFIANDLIKNYFNALVKLNVDLYKSEDLEKQYNLIKTSDITEFESTISANNITSEFIQCLENQKYERRNPIVKKMKYIYDNFYIENNQMLSGSLIEKFNQIDVDTPNIIYDLKNVGYSLKFINDIFIEISGLTKTEALIKFISDCTQFRDANDIFNDLIYEELSDITDEEYISVVKSCFNNDQFYERSAMYEQIIYFNECTRKRYDSCIRINVQPTYSSKKIELWIPMSEEENIDIPSTLKV